MGDVMSYKKQKGFLELHLYAVVCSENWWCVSKENLVEASLATSIDLFSMSSCIVTR